MSTYSTWHTLPNEIKLAIVDNLDLSTARVFSKVDFQTYKVCVPSIFKVSHQPQGVIVVY